ncbi:hypothetical protein [Rhizobium etli]|uniref:hypothetical protein n=1 Tax=Rhizobium etli TaxID=29449 RepID=UPI0018C87A58|nr:hypothetical protein [Rhizobium etli]
MFQRLDPFDIGKQLGPYFGFGQKHVRKRFRQKFHLAHQGRKTLVAIAADMRL